MIAVRRIVSGSPNEAARGAEHGVGQIALAVDHA